MLNVPVGVDLLCPSVETSVANGQFFNACPIRFRGRNNEHRVKRALIALHVFALFPSAVKTTLALTPPPNPGH